VPPAAHSTGRVKTMTIKGQTHRPQSVNNQDMKEQWDNIFGGTWLLKDKHGVVVDEFEKFLDAQNYRAINHQGEPGMKITKK